MEILEWDSSFFGYNVGKVIASGITTTNIKEIMHQAKSKNIKLLYLFTEPTDAISANNLKIYNAKLVDQKITFSLKIDDSCVLRSDDNIESLEFCYPSKQLRDLSIQSGQYSRYKVDPNFKNNEFEKLYYAWIENSLNKKIADYTLVYKKDVREIGFVTLKTKNSCGHIGLIAVDENSRGKSIGKKLIASVINILLEKKIASLEVATQKENISACIFYNKVGFKELLSENIYHIWL